MTQTWFRSLEAGVCPSQSNRVWRRTWGRMRLEKDLHYMQVRKWVYGDEVYKGYKYCHNSNNRFVLWVNRYIDKRKPFFSKSIEECFRQTQTRLCSVIRNKIGKVYSSVTTGFIIRCENFFWMKAGLRYPPSGWQERRRNRPYSWFVLLWNFYENGVHFLATWRGITNLVWINREQWREDENISLIYKTLLHLNLSRKLSNYPPYTFSIRYVPIPIFRGSNEPTTTIIFTDATASRHFYTTAPVPRLLRRLAILC